MLPCDLLKGRVTACKLSDYDYMVRLLPALATVRLARHSFSFASILAIASNKCKTPRSKCNTIRKAARESREKKRSCRATTQLHQKEMQRGVPGRVRTFGSR